MRRFDGYDAVWLLIFLCKLQRNEPGCDVGEHIQVRFRFAGDETAWFRASDDTEIDRLGEVGRSSENLTDGASGGEP